MEPLSDEKRKEVPLREEMCGELPSVAATASAGFPRLPTDVIRRLATP